MRIPRLYYPGSLAPDQQINLPPERANYLLNVLRLKTGAALYLFDGKGHEFTATLTLAPRKQASVTTGQAVERDNESPLQITLAQGISHGERMDYTLQKAVELGITHVQPLETRRTNVKLDGARRDKRRQHWQQVMISACEQSGRSVVPNCAPIDTLGNWLSTLKDDGTLKLLLDPKATQGLSALTNSATNILLLAGPEGGLAEEEAALLYQYGFKGLRLGPRILRTETAAVAALVGLQTLLGDLG